jgi:exonuclease VII small subunit
MNEEYEKARSYVEECKNKLSDKKKQVRLW